MVPSKIRKLATTTHRSFIDPMTANHVCSLAQQKSLKQLLFTHLGPVFYAFAGAVNDVEYKGRSVSARLFSDVLRT